MRLPNQHKRFDETRQVFVCANVWQEQKREEKKKKNLNIIWMCMDVRNAKPQKRA